MAMFGNLRPPAGDTDALKESVEQALGPEWSPFVETWSKTDGEWTVIFTKTGGDGLRMLIVTSDREDGLTLLQVGVSGRAVRLWLGDPSQCVKRVSGRQSKDRGYNEARQAVSDVSDSSQSSSLAFRPPPKLGER